MDSRTCTFVANVSRNRVDVSKKSGSSSKTYSHLQLTKRAFQSPNAIFDMVLELTSMTTLCPGAVSRKTISARSFWQCSFPKNCHTFHNGISLFRQMIEFSCSSTRSKSLFLATISHHECAHAQPVVQF